MFDLSITKILVLAVLALVIFGPEQLPRLAAQAGRGLRDLRRLADNAKTELTEGLGPEFADFDLADLHPRTFVRKHLLEDPVEQIGSWGDGVPAGDATGGMLAAGETPPYDAEAT